MSSLHDVNAIGENAGLRPVASVRNLSVAALVGGVFQPTSDKIRIDSSPRDHSPFLGV
jgi:hypothetical protein